MRVYPLEIVISFLPDGFETQYVRGSDAHLDMVASGSFNVPQFLAFELLCCLDIAQMALRHYFLSGCPVCHLLGILSFCCSRLSGFSAQVFSPNFGVHTTCLTLRLSYPGHESTHRTELNPRPYLPQILLHRRPLLSHWP